MKQRHHRKVQMTQTNSTILWNYVLLWTITPHQVNPVPLQEAVSHSCSDTKSSGVEANVCVARLTFISLLMHSVRYGGRVFGSYC